MRHLPPSISLVAICAVQYHLAADLLLEHAPSRGPSMLPTFAATGESVLVSRLHRRGRGLRVGDCVVYEQPFAVGTVACKRVVGLPGDYVVLGAPPPRPGRRRGQIGGKEEGGDGGRERGRGGREEEDEEIEMMQVPEGHMWVLGDNLSASRDSRMVGPVPLALVRGKVVAKLEWADRWIPRLRRVDNSLCEVD